MNLVAAAWSPPTWACTVLLVLSWLAGRALVLWLFSAPRDTSNQDPK